MNHIRKHYKIAVQFCRICDRETSIEIQVFGTWHMCCPNRRCSVKLKNLPYEEIIELTEIVMDEEPQFANMEDYLL